MTIKLEDNPSQEAIERVAREEAARLTALYVEELRNNDAYHRHISVKEDVTLEDIQNPDIHFFQLVRMAEKPEHGLLVDGDMIDDTLNSIGNPELIQKVRESDWGNISPDEFKQLERALRADQKLLYDFLERRVENLAEIITELGKNEDLSRRELKQQLMKSELTELFDPNSYKVSELPGYKTFFGDRVPDHFFTKIPGHNFDIERYFKLSAENQGLDDSIAQNIPGTNEEWGFYVALHELEHVAANNQFHIDRLVNGMMEHATADTLFTTDGLRAQLQEIEADIAATQASEGIINPEIPAYWAASRMADSDHAHMQLGMKQALCIENGAEFYLNEVVAAHDTGFHLDEYNQTGEVPNYFEMQTAVNGFYLDTAQFLRAELKEELTDEQFAGFDYENMPMPSIAQNMSIVQKALMADPPVYTPEEMHIAQRYLENMSELGIEPEPITEYVQEVRNAVDRELNNGNVVLERDNQHNATINGPIT